LTGAVLDPSGANIPGAGVTLTLGSRAVSTKSGPGGRYEFRALAPGAYVLTATAKGFAPLSIPDVEIVAGSLKELNLPLAIEVEQQQVTVEDENQSVSVSPDQNANAVVIKGSALDALSDDPDELQSELQALAGPAAGPNGGQIYIDGFEGGQIPPKSSILEIRVNQNPFSAEYDRIGYGRVEIITKPGSQKLQGRISSFGTDSALDTANPFLPEKPGFYQYAYFGNVSGPISKTASYFFDAFNISRQNQSVVDAFDPTTLSNFSEAYPAPMNYFEINPRVDFELTRNNFISIRDFYNRYSAQGLNVGTLSLPQQASSAVNSENEVQIGDTWVVSPRLLMEPRFLWRRVSNNQSPNFLTPTVTLQGAFTTGGASSGTLHDHQDVFMLQDYGTATAGPHTLRFGARARSYRDANYTTSGVNGSYFFSNKTQYEACSQPGAQPCTPSLYSATIIANRLARALLFDGSLFLQDDWRVNRSFQLGLGLRYEGQNYIHDHADWAPRLAFAWSPGHPGKSGPKTVLRAGYGWFFNRFIMNTAFNSGVTPYIIEAIHDNLINQQSYTVTNPAFYNPAAAEPQSVLTSSASSIPTYHSVDPHFHAALDMQGGIGLDRQFTKRITGNLTYLYTQGVHQYLTGI